MAAKIFIFAFLFVVTYLCSSISAQLPNPALPCDTTACNLPDCRCSSTSTPGGLTPATTPQIVYLTFDDAVTTSNYPLYQRTLFGRKNPNNSSISATFFVAHEYSDYRYINDLYRRGHDIALHSITHVSNTAYWGNLNATMWEAEIYDQRRQVSYLASIPENEIKGLRAPFLQGGGDVMYNMLNSRGFDWECSRPTWAYRKPGMWPYTNDYLSTQDCQISPCPTGTYKGFWTVPMVDFLGGDLFPCAMVDTCLPTANTSAETVKLLKDNFLDHYEGSRAPYGIFTHAAWLVDANREQGYVEFLDYLGTLPDVYIVSVSKALEWVKSPTPVAQLVNFSPWAPKDDLPDNCYPSNNCRFNGTQTPTGAERYMQSCPPCYEMANYPWIFNPLGR